MIVALLLAGVVYPFSVIPGGLPPDHLLSKKGCYYAGFRFAGELMWTDHCITLKKGEPMAGTRRARCGNPIALRLPPGANVLPRPMHFLVPLMESPLPVVEDTREGIVAQTWPPLTQPSVEGGLPGAGIGIWVPTGGGPPPCRKHKPCRVEGQPTPEPSTWVAVVLGLIGLIWAKRRQLV